MMRIEYCQHWNFDSVLQLNKLLMRQSQRDKISDLVGKRRRVCRRKGVYFVYSDGLERKAGNSKIVKIAEVSGRLSVNLPDCVKFCCENSENGAKEGNAKPLISDYFG